MSQNVKVYTSDEVVIVFGPVLIESGLDEDDFVEVTQDSDDVEDVCGCDGEVSISRTNDKRADIKIRLMQTSDHNDALSILSNLIRTAPGMTGGVVPFVLKDRNGRALYTAQNAWVKKPPDPVYGKKVKNREWTLRAAHLIRVDGGN